MNWQEQFVKDFNEAFGEPFLPKGFAAAEVVIYDRPFVRIIIGDREVDFDGGGNWGDSGFNVGSGIQWNIIKVEEG